MYDHKNELLLLLQPAQVMHFKPVIYTVLNHKESDNLEHNNAMKFKNDQRSYNYNSSFK